MVTGAHFSILWVHMCCPKKTSRKSQILHFSSLNFGCSHLRILSWVWSGYSGPLLICWKRPRWVLSLFPYQWLAKWGMGQACLSSTRKKHLAQVNYILIIWKLVMWNWQAVVLWQLCCMFNLYWGLHSMKPKALRLIKVYPISYISCKIQNVIVRLSTV